MIKEIAQPESIKKDFLDVLWDFFSSVRMAIWLLSISAVAILIGTVVEQNQSPEKYRATYGPTLAYILQLFHIGDLYHSWWFEVLMSLICINLILSNFNRAEKILKKFYHPSLRMEAAYFEHAPDPLIIQTRNNFKDAISKLENSLRSLKYQWKHEEAGDSAYFYAHRGVLALWGSTVAHIGLLLLFIAVIYGHWPGQSFERNVALLEGSSYTIPESRFRMTLKKFTAKWDENRRPLLYRSTVEVHDDRGKTFAKDIEVNSPLQYRGVKIYQSTYGPGMIQGHYVDPDGRVSPFSIEYQEDRMMFFPVKLSHGKTWVGVIRHFVPDFIVSPAGVVGSLSKEPVNPGLDLTVVTQTNQLPPDPKSIRAVGWITQRHSAVFEGTKFYLDRVSLFSGFQLRKDPGVFLIFSSFVTILLGVCLTFYFHHKVLRAKISSGETGMAVVVVGARKDKEQEYDKEFQVIADALQEEMSAPSPILYK